MKDYLLFTYDRYYPGGGWNDFRDSFDSFEEAVKVALKRDREHYQIVHLSTGTIVDSSE